MQIARRTAALVLTLALLGTGCAPDDQDASPPIQPPPVIATTTASAVDDAPTPSGFRRFASAGESWEIEHFRSLKQLVTRSDLAFVGTVTGGHWGREYRDVEVDASGTDVMVSRDLVLTLHLDDIIQGEPAGAPTDSVDVVIDMLDPPFKLDPPVGEQAVFFLRRIGAPIPGHDFPARPKRLAEELYRPVSSIGVLAMDRGKLAFPLGGGADWSVDLLQLTWDRAIAEIKELS